MKPATAFIAIVCSLFCLEASRADDAILKASGETRWLRGNMHTHSFWSDGDNFPEMIARWYKEHGYQFLVFTDHNTLHNKEKWIDISKAKNAAKALEALGKAYPADWIVTREQDGRKEVRLKTFDEVFENVAEPQKYLLIQGEEITDKFGKLPVHLCATNVDELLPPLGGDSVTEVIQRNIDAARARRERTGVRTLVHLNHPNFGYAVTAEQLIPIVGDQFFEVYNGHPGVHNSGDQAHVSTERMWDIVNTFRLTQHQLPLMYGLATDDGHAYFETEPGKASQPGRGWVMVLANTLTPDAIVDALEAGRFYSSSGVTLSSIHSSKNALEVTVTPEEGVTYRIDFIGTREIFSRDSEPAALDPALENLITRKYSDDIGAVLKSVDGTSGRYEFDGSEVYVRAVVTSSRVHPNPSEPGEFERAWVQPVTPGR